MTALTPSLKTRRRFSLNWPYLGAIAGGGSAIDLSSMALRSLRDARSFAREYGFDVERPEAVERIRAAHGEAVQFIATTFLDEPQRALIPAEVAAPDDVLELLLHASRHAPQNVLLRCWSCAVLKVMHGIFYMDNNLKLRHFPSIRRQVFDSLEAVVRCADGKHFLTDGELCLPLVQYEKKSNKGRRSILLKLLQKAEYVAADIYDHLGVRMTFETRFECLLAMQLLQRAHLLSAINIESHRTRNSLFDLDTAKQVFSRYRALLERAEQYPLALLRRIDAEMQALAPVAGDGHNPHSASSYRSLQITVRKMVHLAATDDGEAGVRPELGCAAGSAAGPASFFFNYEIQLLDRASLERTASGPSSHGAYKQRQVATARLRVLGPVLLQWLHAQAPAAVAGGLAAAAPGREAIELA